MTDDTSRDALIEQVENLLMDERDKYPRVHNDAPSADLAETVVDAVVMPLVQDRDICHERWRQLMRDHEAVVRERDELEAENERLRNTARNYEIAMYGARGERDGSIREREAAEAAHKALTEAVRELADAWEDDARPVAGRIVFGLRAILDKHGEGR